jgi:hypothetical protein
MSESETKPVVRGDLPLATNPLSLMPHRAALDVPGTPGGRAFGAAEVALSAMHDALGEMADTKKYVNANAKLTGEKVMVRGMAVPYAVNGQEDSLREAMGRSFERSGQVVDRQKTAIEKSIQEIEAAISGKLVNPLADKPSTVAVSSEIRSHVKAMKESDRTLFVQSAVMNGDLDVVAAILNASPWTSGLTPKQHGELRVFAAEHFPATKADYVALEATRAVLGKLEMAGNAFVSKFAELLPPDIRGGKAEAAKKIAALASGKTKERA